jgi:hypothetical protein
VKEVMDAMGNLREERSALGDDVDVNLAVSHTFGPVEATLGIGFSFYGSVGTTLEAIPLTLRAHASFTGPQKDYRYAYQQEVSATHKWFLSPRRFAFVAWMSALLTEAAVPKDGMRTEGTLFWCSPGITGEAQLTRRLGLYLWADASLPVVKSGTLETQTVLTSGLTLLLATRKWDFALRGSLGDITHADPSTSIGVAVYKRWGL